MNRRSFLGSLAALGSMAFFGKQLAELIQPMPIPKGTMIYVRKGWKVEQSAKMDGWYYCWISYGHPPEGKT